MRRVPAGNASLAADERGSGPSMILLHAGVADRLGFADLASALSGYRTIAYDRRGFGETTAPAEIHAHVDDLIALLDHFEIASAILVGNSQGGRIAIDAALTHPRRVRALVLIAPALSGAAEPEVYSPAVEALGAAIEAAEAAGDLDAVNELEARLWLDGPDQPAGRVGGATRALFLDMNGRALRAAPVGDEREPPSAVDLLGDISVPALVICGEYDLEPIIGRARDIADAIPAAQLLEVPAAAHLPQLERPEVVVAAIRALLE